MRWGILFFVLGCNSSPAGAGGAGGDATTGSATSSSTVKPAVTVTTSTTTATSSSTTSASSSSTGTPCTNSTCATGTQCGPSGACEACTDALHCATCEPTALQQDDACIASQTNHMGCTQAGIVKPCIAGAQTTFTVWCDWTPTGACFAFGPNDYCRDLYVPPGTPGTKACPGSRMN